MKVSAFAHHAFGGTGPQLVDAAVIEALNARAAEYFEQFDPKGGKAICPIPSHQEETGSFGYKVTPESPLTITLEDDLVSLDRGRVIDPGTN